MKKIVYILSVICGFMTFTSCNDTTSDDVSKITYFVTFEMQGDETMLVPVGTTFSDPGVKAMEGTTDVSSSVKVDGSVNSNEIGLYNLTYSATNVDGFGSSTERTVLVYDPAVDTDISGTYAVADGSYRFWNSSSAKVSFSGYSVTITQSAPGIFYISDYMGGYYDKRAGYGASYAMTGYFKLNADNSIEELSSHINGWGDSLESLDNAKYDPETGSISYEAPYAGSMVFFITLTK